MSSGVRRGHNDSGVVADASCVWCVSEAVQVTSDELTLALLHDKYLEGEGGVFERISKQKVG